MSRHLDYNQKGGCEELALRRSQTGQAWLELQSDAGAGVLGVLTTHETSPCFALGNAGSTRLG